MKVCVFGAGNMGARIAEVFLTHGHDVTMIDIKQEFLDRGVKTITNDLSFMVKKEKITEDHKNELLAGLKTSIDRKSAADADFVMEVILERMDLKKELLKEPGSHDLRFQHLRSVPDRAGGFRQAFG